MLPFVKQVKLPPSQRKHAMVAVLNLSRVRVNLVPNIHTIGRQVLGVAVVVTLLGVPLTGDLVLKVVVTVRKIEPSHAVQPQELKLE